MPPSYAIYINYINANHFSQATFGERCAADMTASLSAFSLRRSGNMWLVLIRFSCMIARLDPFGFANSMVDPAIPFLAIKKDPRGSFFYCTCRLTCGHGDRGYPVCRRSHRSMSGYGLNCLDRNLQVHCPAPGCICGALYRGVSCLATHRSR